MKAYTYLSENKNTHSRSVVLESENQAETEILKLLGFDKPVNSYCDIVKEAERSIKALLTIEFREK